MLHIEPSQREASSSLEIGAPTNRRISHPQGLEHLCQMLPREAAFSEDLGFMSLDDIGHLIFHSDSWMYANNVVPIYGPDGSHVNANKVPPFPWEQLPAPCIKVGKKLWTNVSIRDWVQRFVIRALSPMDASRVMLEVDHE